MIGTTRKRLFIAMLFLLPNLIGFLMFTAGPVLFSVGMSFTDWAITKHNPYSDRPIRFVGLENYQRLLVGDESELFWNYFGNTLFLMIAIPVGIAGSLVLALMLHARATPTRTGTRLKGALIATGVGAVACVAVYFLMTPDEALKAVRSTETGLTDRSVYDVQELRASFAVLVTAVLAGVVALGMAIGQVFFRTVFYLPTLLAGVAMFLLWKTLYRPRGGLINAALQPVLDTLEQAVNNSSPILWRALAVVVALAFAYVVFAGVARGLRLLAGGDYSPLWFACRLVVYACIAFVGFGLFRAVWNLPDAAAEGLDAPAWLIDSRWAKTALVIMGVWLAVGGGNMLLYLAGLSNIPPELYEAAAIDGASSWQRFLHVTWPQLAPTTFFIVIMSTIGGLQGGFEQALVMTEGKADTIVLTYYLYNIAFTDNFQLGLASAVAWIMFAFIFVMTAVNFRYGSRMTND